MLKKTLLLSAIIALSSGCAAKKIQTDLDSCNGDLTACQTALAQAQKPKGPQFADARLNAYRDLAKQFRDAFGSDDINILVRDGRMIVQLPNEILFDSGKAALKADGQSALDKISEIVKANGKRRFLLAGHTDNVPVTGGKKFDDNWELSTLRATNAVKYLQAQGVNPKQIGAAGFGEYLPHTSNDTDEGKAENRRLEIIIFPTVNEIPKFPKDL